MLFRRHGPAVNAPDVEKTKKNESTSHIWKPGGRIKPTTEGGNDSTHNQDLLISGNNVQAWEMSTDTPEYPSHRAPSKDTIVLGKRTNQQGTIRQNVLSSSPWRRTEHLGASQKADVSTMTHNINANGVLPRFDGAGDSANHISNPPESAPVCGVNTAAAKTGPASHNGPATKWYLKTPRTAPDPMDVRAFFRMLREEERVMILKYRNQRRPFG
jgi:hypothetical protein